MIHTEHQKTFTTPDGIEHSYRYWSADSVNQHEHTPTVILFSRYQKNKENTQYFIEKIGLDNFQFFSWDGPINSVSKQSSTDPENFSSLVYETRQFIEHVKLEYRVCDQDIAVIAQDIEAVSALVWVHDYAADIKALVLSSPALQVKTHTSVSKNFIKDLVYASKRVIKDAHAIYVPTLFLVSCSKKDIKIKNKNIFYQSLSCTKKEISISSTPCQDIFEKKSLPIELAKINHFIKDCFTSNVSTPSLTKLDKSGYTKEETDRLSKPETSIIRKAYWKLNHMAMRTIGTYSNGIKLGLDTGFDSGISLDYIYKNQAQGKNKLGRYIDHTYLNHAGWRGVRLRKKHVEELMLLAITQLLQQNKKVNILDIAAGHGRYILDTAHKFPQQIDHILMRDYDDKNVKQGQILIQERGLTDFAKFEKADAFSSEDLSTLPTDRTLAIASGFYELFSDNSMLSKSLNGIANSMEDNGYLIYTGIPWHPQLEYMARVLTRHQDGEPWCLRRRIQLELDQLVAEAGFQKVTQRIDPWGIFSVSLAKRVRNTIE